MKEDTNVTTVIGRLTKDAEMKRNTDMPFGFFTIATSRRKKANDGTYAAETSYIDVSICGNYANAIIGSLKKGMQVCVTGRLKQERWTDARTSEKKSRLVIMSDSVQITGEKA
jgi:single-strand DNA-binding protein